MARCSYFFGIFPNDTERAATMARAYLLRDILKLTGDLIDPARLHMTSLFLGRHSHEDREFELRAIDAGNAAKVAPFSVTFDVATSFKQDDRIAASVFEAKGPVDDVHALHHKLLAAMREPAPDVLEKRPYRPHATWLYGHDKFDEQAITPITWQADCLVLACAMPGEQNYRRVHEWHL